jgi:hypothetical protein
MALTLDYDFNGVLVRGAHVSVFHYQGDKSQMKVEFGVRLPGASRMFHSFAEMVPVNAGGGNNVAQAYTWLKAQPGFESAVDC